MSALDDIQGHARAAHGSFGEAKDFAREAADEAVNLEQEAAGHGWSGVSSRMSSVQETCDLVISAIDDVMDATTSGMTLLEAIHERMSSNEVANYLGQAGGTFTSAHTEAGAAGVMLVDARTAAEGADAYTVAALVSDAETCLDQGLTALTSAADGTRSEAAMATDWGSGTAERAVVEVPKPLLYVSSPKHGRVDRGNISKAPEDGQAALHRFAPVHPETTDRRIGVDPERGEIVVFDETNPGTGRFHGHVKAWQELRPRERSALYKAGLVDLRGRIVR